jgi:hypothetical protein
MATLTINNLSMPDDFPAAAFEAVHKRLLSFNKTFEYVQFVGAWSALSYRYLATVEYDESFVASILQNGPGPGPSIRYAQERDLFGFFSNGLSVFDAFSFGMFSIGAILVPDVFPLASADDERKVTFGGTLKSYRSAFTNDPFTAELQKILNDGSFQELRDLRNFLTHRAVPARHFSLVISGSGSKPTAELGRINIGLDQHTTSARRQDIVRLLKSALLAAREFAEVHVA